MSVQKFDLIGQRQIRIDKAQKLRDMGINPYPSRSNRDTLSDKIVNNFDDFQDKQVTVAGRLMSWREHGHLVFGHLQDQNGQIQLYIKDDVLQPTSQTDQTLGFSDLELLDVGDIVEATGTVTKTKKGEISILVEKLRILTKAIRPLPNKWDGLKDKEKIFRQRYLDHIMNPDKKERFEKMAKITFAIREFLAEKGFLEIKTPILQPIYGGTNAKPFTTQVNALNSQFYMSVSHELYLKRLTTAGFDNVLNITGYFRNEGIDRSHNPEFQMLETMTAYQNYEYNMQLIEELYKYIGERVFGRTTFIIGGKQVDFGKPWKKMRMLDAVKELAGYDFDQVTSLDQAHQILAEVGEEERPNSIGESMVKVFEAKVEEQLIEPTFITSHPVEISPLAKQMDEDPRFVERFEIFIGGIEGGDNWSELNDPVELYKRLSEQVERGRGGDDESHPMDIEFIEMMEYGMPPTTGLGPGIERMAMMFTETEYIDDVIYFPMMKPAQISSTQKKIYGEEYLLTKNDKKQDFGKKMVIVLNKEITDWRLTNTIGHISAYLGNKIKQDEFATRDSFTTKGDTTIHANSQYAIVTLTAKPGQMFNLLEKIKQTNLPHLAYVQEMTETTDDEQLQALLADKRPEELLYLGIGIFGDIEEVDNLTKKFSLFKL